MKKTKPQSWSKTLLNLAFVIPSLLNIVRHFISCIENDMELAKRSFVSLLVLSMMAVTLIIGTWFCICIISFFWLSSWLLNPMAALAVILIIHFLLLLIIALVMLRVKDKMLFTCTRDLFH